MHALHLIAGIVITLAGIVQVYGAILDTDPVFQWRGQYAPGSIMRKVARVMSAVLGIVFVIAGLSYLLTFFSEAG